MAKQRTKPIVIPDSIPDDLKEAILGSKYPHVARVADPLLVRVDQLSLMVADVVYHARIKLGLGGKGFYIYASGLGTAIYENMFMHDKNDVKFNAEFGVSSNDTDESILSKIAEKAEDWLDALEVAIASKQSDNPIKKAIDRMCWQLHYDITESHANFPVMFKSDDFSDVKIDRYPLETEWWDGCTLKSSISNIAGVTYRDDTVTDPTTHETIHKIVVDNKGYLNDSAQNLKKLDDHLNAGAYSDTEGSIKKLDDHFNNSQTGSITKMTSAIGTFDTNATTKLGSIATKLVPDGNDYYSISECLRDKQAINGKTTFSIARSLREGSEDSVSQATYDQTQLESQRFTNIDNTLGTPSDSTASTIFGSISSNSSTINGNISDAQTALSGDISGAESSINGNISGVNDTVGDINRNLGTKVLGDIGGNVSTKTAMDVLADMHSALFGHECNTNDLASHDYRGSYGIAWGPTSGSNSTLYVKSVDL